MGIERFRDAHRKKCTRLRKRHIENEQEICNQYRLVSSCDTVIITKKDTKNDSPMTQIDRYVPYNKGWISGMQKVLAASSSTGIDDGNYL